MGTFWKKSMDLSKILSFIRIQSVLGSSKGSGHCLFVCLFLRHDAFIIRSWPPPTPFEQINIQVKYINNDRELGKNTKKRPPYHGGGVRVP